MKLAKFVPFLVVLAFTLTACSWREYKIEGYVVSITLQQSNVAIVTLANVSYVSTSDPSISGNLDAEYEWVFGTTASPEILDLRVGDHVTLICLNRPSGLFARESCKIVSEGY